MASQREIKVGSRDFVIRVAGEDVPVEVIGKVEGAEGERPEWKLKNLKTGRTLTRGSAAIRRAGEPAKQAPAGFGRRPGAAAPAHQLQNPAPASFGSQFGSQPFGSKPATFGSHVRRTEPKADGPLGSLRGKIKVPTKPVAAPVPATVSPKNNTEEERQPRRRGGEHYPSDLVRDMCEALKRTSGTEWEVRNVFANVLAEYNSRRFYPGFPSGV